MKICILDTCDKQHDSHGYCANHARQFRRWGRIRSKEELSNEIAERNKNNKANLGKKWTDEAKKRHSEKLKGRTLNTGRTHFKKGFESWNTGKSDWMTEVHKESLRRASTGRTPWNKGKKVEQMQGERNWMWAGDSVSYRTLHKWVERYLGKPTQCSECKVDGLSNHQIHWSNISGDYKRDLNDWQRLCAKCHGAYDRKLRVARMRG